MKDERSGKFTISVSVSDQLFNLGVPPTFVAEALAIELGDTRLKAYLRKPALNGMIRFFELAAIMGLPLKFQKITISAFLNDLDERSSGSAYWSRYATAMQEVAREMGFPFDIVDGFEMRLGPAV